MSDRLTLSVFTKPWKQPLPELARFVQALGFDAIEYPLRPGYPVEPQDVVRGLPQVVHIMADHGLAVASIAGPTDEATIATCAELGIPIIRVMTTIGEEGYWAGVERAQREFDALVPLLDKYGVQVGVQNHCGRFVNSTMGLMHLLSKYEPRHIAAVWDAAHNAIVGEEPELALDMVWERLCMVNLKNCIWQRTNGPEAEYAQWRTYWTTGRHGLAPWPLVAAELKRRGYHGVVCLTAEYSDGPAVNRLIAEDIAFARSLFD